MTNIYTEQATIYPEQLDFWWENRYNVLIYGDHGTGKTSIISEFFKKKTQEYRIFSGATLDPWTDLIGVPKMVRRSGKYQLEFATPQAFDEKVEAIFIDEYNRSHPKVRNALLELTQFGSINGKKFPKLKCVWAAANPKDTINNYDVDEMDPAQEDRFQIIVKISNKPYKPYFSAKYSKEIADSVFSWYESLGEESSSAVSPRRLDYGINHVLKGGSAREIFPDERINVSSFSKAVRGNEKMKEISSAVKSGDKDAISEIFSKQTKIQGCMKEILENAKYTKLFIEYGDMEHILSVAEANDFFATLLCESEREEKRVSIENYKKIHGKYPDWHTKGYSSCVNNRSVGNAIVSQISIINKAGISDIKVPELAPLLSQKDASEVLEEFRIPEGLFLSKLDYSSATNALKFCLKCESLGQTNFQNEKISQKYFSILYSGFNFFYERDGNLMGAFYEIKGSEKAFKIIPRNNQIQIAPQAKGRLKQGAYEEVLA